MVDAMILLIPITLPKKVKNIAEFLVIKAFMLDRAGEWNVSWSSLHFMLPPVTETFKV